jgi:hypothetical protein
MQPVTLVSNLWQALETTWQRIDGDIQTRIGNISVICVSDASTRNQIQEPSTVSALNHCHVSATNVDSSA